MALRLFIAIPIDEASANAFQAFKSSMHPLPKGFRWMAQANWHITVLFLGRVEENKLNNIKQTLHRHLEDIPPFTMRFEKYELRFRNKHPSMVWARYQPQERLEELAKGIHRDLSAYVELEPLRPQFIPHITLARIKPTKDKTPVSWEKPLMPPDLPVKQCILYQSQLTSEGARYILRLTHDLN